jgi:hypothetical protein
VGRIEAGLSDPCGTEGRDRGQGRPATLLSRIAHAPAGRHDFAIMAARERLVRYLAARGVDVSKVLLPVFAPSRGGAARVVEWGGACVAWGRLSTPNGTATISQGFALLVGAA